MSIGQKSKDALELLKRSKKWQIIAGVVVFLFLFSIFGNNSTQPRRQRMQQPQVNIGTLSTREHTDGVIAAFRTHIEQTREDIKRIDERMIVTDRKIEENERRTAEILKTMLERMDQQQAATAPSRAISGDYAPIPLPGIPSAPGSTQEPQMPFPGIQPVSMERGSLSIQGLYEESELEQIFPDDTPLVVPPRPPEPERIAFIGAGDSVRVKLLAGVNAPTNGTPYPVVFKLVGDVIGPDGTVLPLGEARLLAAAQGSLVDQRALFRLTSLSIRLPNGERKVVDVDGWIVGEDGLRGMEGILIDPIGKAIAGSVVTGTVEGAGRALSAAQRDIYRDISTGSETEVFTGDVAAYALGQGAARGAQQWNSIIRERLSKLSPVVKVYSDREGTAVFARSLTIPGLYEALNAEEEFY